MKRSTYTIITSLAAGLLLAGCIAEVDDPVPDENVDETEQALLPGCNHNDMGTGCDAPARPAQAVEPAKLSGHGRFRINKGDSRDCYRFHLDADQEVRLAITPRNPTNDLAVNFYRADGSFAGCGGTCASGKGKTSCPGETVLATYHDSGSGGDFVACLGNSDEHCISTGAPKGKYKLQIGFQNRTGGGSGGSVSSVNLTKCAGKEVDLQSDVANCGACGVTCAANQSCMNGSCA